MLLKINRKNASSRHVALKIFEFNESRGLLALQIVKMSRKQQPSSPPTRVVADHVPLQETETRTSGRLVITVLLCRDVFVGQGRLDFGPSPLGMVKYTVYTTYGNGLGEGYGYCFNHMKRATFQSSKMSVTWTRRCASGRKQDVVG